MKTGLVFIQILLALASLLSSCNAKQTQRDWPEWDYFKTHYISSEGRVIDPSDARQITTSEGQSYALFFALVANDPVLFDKVLIWTEQNLAFGNLSSNLPAWLWGKTANNSWGILDKNSASDADLWIAYDLIEAGRLWHNVRYQKLGLQMLDQIAQHEIDTLPGFGKMLLPWSKELNNPKKGIVLNPSYSPPQLLDLFSHWPGPWTQVRKYNNRFLLLTSPKGLAPDWIIWDQNKGWLPNKEQPYVGSYNAIRVYLWVGMLAEDHPLQSIMASHFHPMIKLTEQLGAPPRTVYTNNGKTDGEGSVGFSAALLPLLAQSNSPALASQIQRVNKAQLKPDAYYDMVLILFGKGYQQQRYHFDKQGKLITTW